MDLYSWLSIFMLAHAVTAFANIHRPRSRGLTTTDPEWNGTIDRRSDHTHLITCISSPNKQLPPVTLLRDLSSKFCSYVESRNSFSMDEPVERSYMMNRIWYSFSLELLEPVEFIKHSERIPSTNTPWIEADRCEENFENIWRACKAHIT
jgi:hypothetical protein